MKVQRKMLVKIQRNVRRKNLVGNKAIIHTQKQNQPLRVLIIEKRKFTQQSLLRNDFITYVFYFILQNW